MKIGFHTFPAWRLAFKKTVYSLYRGGRQDDGQVAAWLEDRKGLFAVSWPKQLGEYKCYCDYKNNGTFCCG